MASQAVPIPSMDATPQAREYIDTCVTDVLHSIDQLTSSSSAITANEAKGRFHIHAASLSKLFKVHAFLSAEQRQSLFEALVRVCVDTSPTNASSSDILLQCTALELAGQLLRRRHIGCSPQIEWRPLWDLLLSFHKYGGSSSSSNRDAEGVGDNVQLRFPCAPAVRRRHLTALLKVIEISRHHFRVGSASEILRATLPFIESAGRSANNGDDNDQDESTGTSRAHGSIRSAAAQTYLQLLHLFFPSKSGEYEDGDDDDDDDDDVEVDTAEHEEVDLAPQLLTEVCWMLVLVAENAFLYLNILWRFSPFNPTDYFPLMGSAPYLYAVVCAVDVHCVKIVPLELGHRRRDSDGVCFVPDSAGL